VEYGIDPGTPDRHSREGGNPAFNAWRASHQPFHWFAEFYGVMQEGGFDVVIGNPPYVEYSKVKNSYTISNYITINCSNLYAFVIERCEFLMAKNGITGMIVPHSAICTDRMSPLMQLLEKSALWISTYDIRPAKLFVGVDQRLSIYLYQKTHLIARQKTFSTKYQRWNEETRDSLFSRLQYVGTDIFEFNNSIPKIGCNIERDIWKSITGNKSIKINLRGNIKLYFHNAPRYWIRAMTFTPYFWNERGGEQLSSHLKLLHCQSETDAKVLAAVINSSLFYWWFIILSNCRDFSMREIENFRLDFNLMSVNLYKKLSELSIDLMQDFIQNKHQKKCQYKSTGKVIYDEFYPRYSKNIIDKIDSLLAKYYGFSDESLDFIINYDIKYRMGGTDEE